MDGDVSFWQRLKAEFQLKNFGLSHPTPSLFVSSQWGCPQFYLGWRVFWALYHVAWIVYNWIDDVITEEPPGTWLIYLTNWNYFFLTLETVNLAALQIYVTHVKREFRDGESTWYLKVTWLLYTIVSDTTLIVTILYFTFLFDGVLTVKGTSTHVLTSVYVILDLAVTAMPVRLFHDLYVDIFAVIYTAFTLIYWQAGGLNALGEPYVYKVLDWANPGRSVTMTVAFLLVGVPLQHAVVWALHVLRGHLFKLYKKS
ncbi:hypothetical protein ACOMHN_021585 [Nucella lapillus]